MGKYGGKKMKTAQEMAKFTNNSAEAIVEKFFMPKIEAAAKNGLRELRIMPWSGDSRTLARCLEILESKGYYTFMGQNPLTNRFFCDIAW